MSEEKNISAVRAAVMAQVPDYEIKPVRTVVDFNTAPFIPFGSDNLFPQASALFARTSPIHRGVINSKRTYLIGGGMASEDPRLQYLFDKANFEGDTINKIASNYFYDKEAGGNGWVEVITDKNRTFLWFNHLDYTKCRKSKDGENCLIHPNWAAYKMGEDIKTIPLYPKFSSERNEYGVFVERSVYHLKEYEPEFYYYGVPSWLAGKDSILIDLKTNKWNLARLKNAFRLSGIMVVPVKDSKEGEDVTKYIEENHTGEDNQAKVLVITKSRAQEGEKADQVQLIETRQDDEGSWDKLHLQSTSDIVIAHSWFRSLTSIADNTGFDTQRILNEYNVAKQTVIQHEQSVFLEFLSRVFKDQTGIDSDLTFINQPPIALKDDAWKKVWEARRDKGLDFDEKDPAQQKIIVPLSSVGYTLV